MVELGELHIRGTLDSIEIENSLRRIEGKMDNFAGQTKSTFGSVNLLSTSVKGLAVGLIGVATSGVAAFTALATKAPAVAPALAKMQIGMMEISHTAGRIMTPIFDSLANNLIPSVGTAISNLDGQWNQFSTRVASGIDILSKGIISLSESLKAQFESKEKTKEEIVSGESKVGATFEFLQQYGILGFGPIDPIGALTALYDMWSKLKNKEKAFVSPNSVGG